VAISLFLTLGGRDWIPALRGWRCDALKIPGARIDAVYAENDRLNPSWYQVDDDHEVIRWSREADPPPDLMTTVLLEKPLKEDVSPGWQKLKIATPVITALLGVLGGIFASGPATERLFPAKTTTPIVRSKSYSVEGRINLTSTKPPIRFQDVEVSVRPPDFVVRPNGVFHGSITLALDKDNRFVSPPTLLFNSGVPGLASTSIPILNENEKSPFGIMDHDLQVKHNETPPKIWIRKHIEFQDTANDSYNPAQQKAKAQDQK
jgi:hypothetical protein